MTEYIKYDVYKKRLQNLMKDNKLDLGLEINFDIFKFTPKLRRNKPLAVDLLTELEDRRFLFAHIEAEHIRGSINSVYELRKYIQDNILKKTDRDSALNHAATKMLLACHSFLEVEAIIPASDDGFYDRQNPFHKEFPLKLTQLRLEIGMALAHMTYYHELDVKKHLAVIIPEMPNYDENLFKEA